MKKTIITLLAVILYSYAAIAQSTYTQELEKAAKTISQKIINSGKKSVAVLDFENTNSQTSELGVWLASVFTTFLENNGSDAFTVKSHTDIEKAIQQIKSENGSGAFDSKTIQRLGEISGSDVIVYGEITLIDNEISVNIRTKNISLNATIGGVLVSFTATDGMRTKYDNYIETKTSSSGASSTSSNGVSGEGTEKTSKNPDCKEKNTGDFCFQNNTKINLTVYFGWNWNSFTLQPGQKQCVYDLPSKSWTYTISDVPNPDYAKNYKATGSLYVEACKEKIFIIK